MAIMNPAGNGVLQAFHEIPVAKIMIRHVVGRIAMFVAVIETFLQLRITGVHRVADTVDDDRLRKRFGDECRQQIIRRQFVHHEFFAVCTPFDVLEITLAQV